MRLSHKSSFLALIFASGLAASPIAAHAEAGGCLKYGAAGAVGGHVAGHHAVLGALAGCATGMYVRHKSRQQTAADAAKWRAAHPKEQKRHFWSKKTQAATAPTNTQL